jgi:formamidopyrimidine-DNA glycosylase
MRAVLTVPELPEVETLRRGLAARITGMRVTAAEIGGRKMGEWHALPRQATGRG